MTPVTTKPDRVPIVLDCDPGVDDTFAILCALRYCDLRAVTTVAGNVSLDHTTRNALAVLELAGSDVAVHPGAAGPLDGSRPDDARHVHGESGLGTVVLPPLTRAPHDTHAVDALLGHCRDGDVTVVAIGPLTNIAQVIAKDPTWVDRVPRLVIMGGSTDAGNVTATAEFNIWADPEAAAVVFGSGVDITMVGLNLTRQVRMGQPEIEVLQASGSPTASFAAEALAFYANHSLEVYGIPKTSMHDPCAVLEVARPDLFERQAMHVVVETAGTHTRGMTVCDQRPNPGAPNAHVLTSAAGAEVVDRVIAAAIDPMV